MAITFQKQWTEGTLSEAQTVTSQRRSFLFFAYVDEGETHEDVLAAAKAVSAEIPARWPPAVLPGEPTALEEILVKSSIEIDPRIDFEDAYAVRVTYIHPASGATQFGPLEIGQERITMRSGGGGRATRYWSSGTARYTAVNVSDGDAPTVLSMAPIDYDQGQKTMRGTDTSTTSVQVILETAKNSTKVGSFTSVGDWARNVTLNIRGSVNDRLFMGYPKGSLFLDTVDVIPRGLPMGVGGVGVDPTEYNVTFVFIASKNTIVDYNLEGDDPAGSIETVAIAREGWQYLDIDFKIRADDGANRVTRPYVTQVEVHTIFEYVNFATALVVNGTP